MLAILGVGTATAFTLPAVRQRPSVRHAILSWWPVCLVLTVAVQGGAIGALVVLGAVAAGLLREAWMLVGPTRRGALLAGLGWLSMTAPLLAATLGVFTPSTGFTASWVLPVLIVVVGVVFRQRGLALAITAVAFGFGAALRLTTVGAPIATGVKVDVGRAVVFIVYATVIVLDALQYAAGKAFGRTPLAPRLSPNKTIEGAVGGALCAVLCAASLSASVLQVPWSRGVVIGVVIAGLGIGGDLMISAAKRRLGVKDSGAVIPGQGGLWDRCDSMLLTVPAATLIAAFGGFTP